MERNKILRKVRDNDRSKDTVQSISPQWKKCVSIGPAKKKLPKIANGKCSRCTLAWCDAYLQLRAKETTESALNSGRLEK